MTVLEWMAGEERANARFRAYQRRWRTGRRFEDPKTIALCVAFIRRSKLLDQVVSRAFPRRAALSVVHGGRAS